MRACSVRRIHGSDKAASATVSGAHVCPITIELYLSQSVVRSPSAVPLVLFRRRQLGLLDSVPSAGLKEVTCYIESVLVPIMDITSIVSAPIQK